MYSKADLNLLEDKSQSQQQEDSAGSQSSEKEDSEELENEKFTNENSESNINSASFFANHSPNPSLILGISHSVPLSPPNS